MLIYKRVERLSEPDDLILDLGAKGGSNVTDTDATVVGIDINFPKSIENSNVEYLYADGRELPFKNGTFDFIVVNQVIEHVERRTQLFEEAERVLKDTGIALFSFPNRFTLNKPHGLPRVLSFLPKPLGLPLAQRTLTNTEYQYYRDNIFPLSPIGARQALNNYFNCLQYITIEESMQSKELYRNNLLPQLFVRTLPLISFVTRFAVLQWIFELVWGYVAYECRNQ